MYKPNSSFTLLLLLLISIGAYSQSDGFLEKTAASEPFIDDETCLHDPSCHRNVTICIFEGCCSVKRCPGDGEECFVAMPRCMPPPEEPLDDETCFTDPNCRRDLTICAFEGCCKYKECPDDGSECIISLPRCMPPPEEPLNDEACFTDPNCRRDLTICAFEGCCKYKECPDDGSECIISLPRCMPPSEELEEPLSDEACFNEPSCRRNVTVCSFEGCCSFKECPADGGECMIAMPMCIAPEMPIIEPVFEVDNETCLHDPECHRNVTVCVREGCCSFKECDENGEECWVAFAKCPVEEPLDDERCFTDSNCRRNLTICAFEGCCKYKECPDDGSECMIALPRCVPPPEEPVMEVDNETCLHDPECHRNVTVCVREGCCSFKECDENGEECWVAFAKCPVEEPLDDEACFNDPNCRRDLTICAFEGCCKYKECPDDGSECIISLPRCLPPPEEPLDDEACFNEPTCRRNLTICAFEGCCKFKECPDDGSECMIALPRCVSPPEEPVKEEPLSDEACFNEPSCRRNVTTCAFEGCCSYKICPDDGSECMIAMPMCVAPEPPILVIEEPKPIPQKKSSNYAKKREVKSKVIKKSSRP